MKEVVKKNTSSKKADVAPKATPVDTSRPAPRRPRGEGNDAAFRDRGAGRESNRSRPTDESGGLRERRGGRGGRGGGYGGGRGRQFDRHSGTDRVDTDKQVSQGWGSNDREWKDEQAGENIAQAEATEEKTAAAAEGEGQEAAAAEEPAAEPEPEDKTKSFAQYTRELAERAPVEELPEARRANEGARDNKKWATAKELVKEEDEDYFIGGSGKSKNVKQRKEKAVVEIDHGFRRSSADRGGRGGGGRGSYGSRGDRPPRGGSNRGEYRGGRGGSRGGFNVSDESAFPSLGSK
ncbi:hypothetical protein AA313_de0200507 [Arthrobotrys entomopaga]|nr:hypothetical protein AA313_de0200507 [Arthrobotrys entomopaga]